MVVGKSIWPNLGPNLALFWPIQLFGYWNIVISDYCSLGLFEYVGDQALVTFIGWTLLRVVWYVFHQLFDSAVEIAAKTI